MNLRLARPDEAQELWGIRNQAVRAGCVEVYDAETISAFTPDTMPAGFRACVMQNPFFVITDTDADRPVATGYLDIERRLVEAIFTLPAYQGRGCASRIMRRIIGEAKARHLPRLALSSTPNAVDFYRRHGFRVLGPAQYYSRSAQRYLPCIEMRLDMDQ
ncbi:GNAT family N-acetyltransferase [Acerihabitans arboris]|uniref:GNAT family N-acetyltransferase n=1 Tax=Acerihabitans arboris TaxID=2691583 RepID=A0A845SDL7_9GAMM|nr:GNAT family N-acetyltransferase [Acerihabitans arboris]NDL63023.1 GNAT family N-acetyltransferase [Acerihabitans arboris]